MIGTRILVCGLALLVGAPAGVALAAMPHLPLYNTDPGDQYGFAVDISGNVVIVGGKGADGSGRAQICTYDGGQWLYRDTLNSADGTLTNGSQFGYSVGLDGQSAVVGALGNDTVYVFQPQGQTWIEDTTARLNVPGAYGLGRAVAISSGRVLTGASESDPGRAYVFEQGTEWDEGTQLTTSLPPDTFGFSVDLSGDFAVVGDPKENTAYFYHYNGGDWIEETAFTKPGASSSDRYGYSVSIDGEYAIVGSGLMYSHLGTASIFHREYDDGNGKYVWQEETLPASDGATFDEFGCSVAISGDLAVVGAKNKGPYNSESGTVYVFRRTGNTWDEVATVRPSDGASGDEFGRAVAVDGDWIVVGASNHESGTGTAYVYSIDNLTNPTPGDANRDGVVDAFDARVLAAHWLTTAEVGWDEGDFNDDGTVNDLDASILAAHWNAGAEGSGVVPEPATIVMLLGGLLLLVLVRRRSP
ncbi:MAG: PEP-CTERM sorting domain-containing protein [Pirellulales bacterium]|nr:PEP-CTERM sorting domain-containing protein [Pirellulales bacterium]